MKLLSKVVWLEGMYLGPHHFQTQARYFEDSIKFAIDALWFAAWGIVSCEMNQEALRNNRIAILSARGILPDGLPFDVPDSDCLPKQREVVLQPTQNAAVVYLALPESRSKAANFTTNSGSEPNIRFFSRPESIYDENNGTDISTVDTGQKAFRILMESESLEGMTVLPIARVKRTGTGKLEYDPSFIPPCLSLGGSDRLISILRRLIEALTEKSSRLMEGRKSVKGFETNWSAADVSNFWFLHCVNSSLPTLKHLLETRSRHPEELFREMSRLAGALCTFGLQVHPTTLPAYDHASPERCFEELSAHIHSHLNIIVPTSAIQIALAPSAHYFWEGDVTDQRCLGRSRWVLGICARATDSEVIARVPNVVKFCSAKFVPELVKRALPGLALTHIPAAPSAISSRVEMHYFNISRSGPCWDHINITKRVGIYVPGDLPAPEVELFVLPEN